MRIIVRRRHDDGEATIGSMHINGECECDTLEDQWQPVKVPGETRIPAGRYELELKRIGESRFDDRAIDKLGDMHKGMIRLKDVPGFTEVLIHWGNFEKDTAGCILVGIGEGKDPHGHHMIKNSWTAYRKIYPKIAKALRARELVTLDVVDADREKAA